MTAQERPKTAPKRPRTTPKRALNSTNFENHPEPTHQNPPAPHHNPTRTNQNQPTRTHQNPTRTSQNQPTKTHQNPTRTNLRYVVSSFRFPIVVGFSLVDTIWDQDCGTWSHLIGPDRSRGQFWGSKTTPLKSLKFIAKNRVWGTCGSKMEPKWPQKVHFF